MSKMRKRKMVEILVAVLHKLYRLNTIEKKKVTSLNQMRSKKVKTQKVALRLEQKPKILTMETRSMTTGRMK